LIHGRLTHPASPSTQSIQQAAVQKAPQLSKEEMAAMRRANDPNFKGACFGSWLGYSVV